MSMLRSNLVVLFTGALALAACETGSGTRPGPTESPSIKSVTPAVANVSVSVANEGRIPVVVERGGAYDGQINLSISGLPNGVVGTFTPTLLGTFNTTSELSLTVFPTAVAGTTTATIRASGAGVAEKTVPLTITVMIPTVSLSVGSGSVTVPRGGSITVPITIVRGGGFTEAVFLSAINLPAGVTASLSPSTIASGATTSTLTLSASIGAPLGTSTMNVRTSALDVAAQTAPLNVTVTDATSPIFQLSPATTLVNVVRGSSGQNTINITRAGGLTAPVSLSIANLPEGVTATFTPASTTEASSVLRLDVSPTAPVGNRTLSVTGSAAGVSEQNSGFTGFTLSVQPLGIAVVSPATLSVSRGSSASFLLNVAKQSSVNEVATVTLTGLPSGLTAQNPGPYTFPGAGGVLASLAMRLDAAATVAPGTYTLTFSGTTPSGLTSTSTTIVTVTP